MDPFVAPAIALIVAYALFPLDPWTAGVTRGAFGASRAGVRATGRSARAQWARNRPSRQVRGRARRQRWRASGDLGLLALWGLETAGRGIGAGVLSGSRAVRAGASAMPESYREASTKARANHKPFWKQPPAPEGEGVTSAPDLIPASQPAAPSDTPTTEGSPTMTDVSLVTQTDLQNIGDYGAEFKSAKLLVDSLLTYLQQLDEWRARFPERHVGRDEFGTDDLNNAIRALGETRVDTASLRALSETLALAEAAVTDASSIGEVGRAKNAKGRVEEYTAA